MNQYGNLSARFMSVFQERADHERDRDRQAGDRGAVEDHP
jgi:hypothetical protein